MSMHKKLILAAGFMFGLACGSAHAFDGFGYGYFPWYGYGNNGPSAYALGNIPAPPYFALHPPVYYSHVITPRPYGRSPFACSCNCHPAGWPVATRIVANRFLQVQPAAPAGPATPKASDEKPVATAQAPALIANPFYEKSSGEVQVAANEEG